MRRNGKMRDREKEKKRKRGRKRKKQKERETMKRSDKTIERKGERQKTE